MSSKILSGLNKLQNNYMGVTRPNLAISHIPVEVFSNRKLGILQAVVIYLRDELQLKYKEIADILNRDQRTIYTSYYQGRKKIAGD